MVVNIEVLCGIWKRNIWFLRIKVSIFLKDIYEYIKNEMFNSYRIIETVYWTQTVNFSVPFCSLNSWIYAKTRAKHQNDEENGSLPINTLQNIFFWLYSVGKCIDLKLFRIVQRYYKVFWRRPSKKPSLADWSGVLIFRSTSPLTAISTVLDFHIVPRSWLDLFLG